jgi:hypothetical protein
MYVLCIYNFNHTQNKNKNNNFSLNYKLLQFLEIHVN